jgi:hypothetical protein
MYALYVGGLTDSNLKIRALLLCCYMLASCIGRKLWSYSRDVAQFKLTSVHNVKILLHETYSSKSEQS